ncbi:hypothetical protein [Gymnodinialimonas ulvae]|uniref:hypothetical protein n=1 Tax=Gymnodinialimonas ulvae TaxID=3126504 RepID=UPI0030ACBBE2
MATRTIIRANGSIPGAVIAAMVFGGIAVFGLRVFVIAAALGEVAPWVWGILGVSLLLLWGVVHVLWNAFGVALILSADGVRKPGPFRGLYLPADGLRLGLYDTVRSGQSGGRRSQKVTEIWSWTRARGAVLLMEARRDAPEVARVVKGAELHLGRRPERMVARGEDGFS